MLRYLAAASLLATPVAAQDMRTFFTRQDCWPVLEFVNVTINVFGELPLFTGVGITQAADDTPVEGAVMFYVNQDSGTWTLATLYGDGSVCINATGNDFEPYAQ